MTDNETKYVILNQAIGHFHGVMEDKDNRGESAKGIQQFIEILSEIAEDYKVK